MSGITQALFMGGGSMGALSFNDFYEDAAPASSAKTFTAAAIGAAAANRIVFVAVAFRTGTLNSATIGGISANILVQVAGTLGLSAAIIAAAVPTGTTANVVLNFSATPAFVAIGTYSCNGASTVALATASSTSTAPSVSVPVANSGGVIACASSGSNVSFGFSGVTTNRENTAFDGDSYAVGVASGLTAQTRTVSSTTSGTNVGFVVASIKPA